MGLIKLPREIQVLHRENKHFHLKEQLGVCLLWAVLTRLSSSPQNTTPGRQSLYSSCSEYYFKILHQSFPCPRVDTVPSKRATCTLVNRTFQEKKSQEGTSTILIYAMVVTREREGSGEFPGLFYLFKPIINLGPPYLFYTSRYLHLILFTFPFFF